MRRADKRFVGRGIAATLVLIVSALFSYSAFSAEVRAVVPSSQSGVPKIELDLRGHGSHKSFVLAAPNRLVIDFPGTVLKASLPGSREFEGIPVRRLRYGIHEDKRLRLVFDLKSSVKHQVEVIPMGSGDRRIIVWFGEKPSLIPAVVKDVPVETSVDGAAILTKLSMDKFQFEDLVGVDESAPEEQPNEDHDKAESPEFTSESLPYLGGHHVGERSLKGALKGVANTLRAEDEQAGTLGVQKFPKNALNKSKRYDVGYQTNVGSVDVGISTIRPQVYMQKSYENTDVKLLLVDDKDNPGTKVSVGVIHNW